MLMLTVIFTFRGMRFYSIFFSAPNGDNIYLPGSQLNIELKGFSFASGNEQSGNRAVWISIHNSVPKSSLIILCVIVSILTNAQLLLSSFGVILTL